MDLRLIALAAVSIIPRAVAQDLELSGGGRLREQFEYFQNREFGEVRPTRDAYLLHRLQLRGEARWGDQLAGLVEIVNALAIGQQTPVAPIDEDRIDVLRAHVDFTPDISGSPRLRIGRQELILGAGRLLSSREGTNVRRAFDGARLTFEPGERTTVDAFAVAPIALERGVFDDETQQGELLFGGQVATEWFEPGDDHLLSEFYYLGRSRQNGGNALVAGREDRHTIGTRLAGTLGGWSIDAEALGQFGQLGGESIRAFGAGAILGYEFGSTPWRPRPGVRLDVISGDRDPDDGQSGTLDPLYPNNSYFNEAAAFAPSNLYNVSPTLTLQPREDLRLDLMWDMAWRYSTRDALYLPGGPFSAPQESGARFIGHSLTAAAELELRENVAMNVAFTHIDAGPAITDAGGRDLTYVAAWINWWF